MTLVQRSQAIASKLKKESELRASKEQARQVQDRTDSIKSWRSSAELALHRLEVLREFGFAVAERSSTDAILACRTFSDNAASRRIDDSDWAAFKAVVEKHVSALGGSALEGAKAVQADVRGLQITGLESMASLQGLQAKFDAMRNEKLSLQNAPWTTCAPDDLRALLGRRAKLREDIDSLSNIEAPPEVQAFLERARKSEALVEHLTPEVREWLEQHDLLGKLRITLGAR